MAVLFNVSQLLREGVGASRRYLLAPEASVHRGDVELIRTPQGVLVRAHLEVVLEATCSRCLAPFGYAERVDFDEVYQQLYDVASGAKLAVAIDADTFTIDAKHTIDIREAVRQYSETAAAMQPLCRPDCPGICAGCGEDLSVAQCRCERAPIDGRWAALEALKLSANG